MARLLRIIFIMMWLMTECYAGIETDPDVVFENGSVKILGSKLDAYKDVIILTAQREGGTSVYFVKNTINKLIVVQLFDDENAEFWLLNPLSDDEAKKIDISPGRNINVSWHGEELIEISWGGMGYRISNFINSNNLNRIRKIQDLLLYDYSSDIYVSFYRDGVEIGKLGEPGCGSKKIDLDLKYISAMDAVFSIESVEVIDEEIEIKYLSNNGMIIKKVSMNSCQP